MPDNQQTILFVDDEEMLREIGEEMLTDLGYKPLLASDGKTAIEQYERHRDEIVLVILDMIMPNMNGEQAFERLLEINPDIKVLISSGYSRDGQANSIIEQGKCGFLQKPYDYDDMSEKIDWILS